MIVTRPASSPRPGAHRTRSRPPGRLRFHPGPALCLALAAGGPGCGARHPAGNPVDYGRLTQANLERRAGAQDVRALRELAYREAEAGHSDSALSKLDQSLKLE